MEKKTVLLVDDDPINHFLFDKVHESIHWISAVYRSYNGQQAVALIKEHCEKLMPVPDVIVLDLHMPIMNGIEFLQEFKTMECISARLGDVVIAVLSSSIRPAEYRQLEVMGVRHIIHKPLTSEKLNHLRYMEFV